MVNIHFGIQMDRSLKKELTRMENMMESGLNGITVDRKYGKAI